ncbi:RNA exonuclease 1 homolog [Ambystoma mexicanum]|uniref:RNA exonuclease 1 homolog n=1 Tax=Ambystoma mexicanum TaxID=8296 RepID=UPI0037E8911E
MLRSSGYFHGIPCPFIGSPGKVRCQRPHCQYSHGRVKSGDKAPEAAELNSNLQELERINKEIDVVKTEVEEEQKKLSLYKLEPESSVPADPEPILDLNENDSSCSSNEVHSCIKARPQFMSVSNKLRKLLKSIGDKKYVVDRRCPATDLEYDPLLNYSAGLLCFTSVNASENGTSGLKRPKALVSGSPQKSVSKELNGSSPIRLEIKLQESDDDELIIDVPPLQPVSKKSRIMKKASGNGELDGFLNTNKEDTTMNTHESVEGTGNESVHLVPSNLVEDCTNQCTVESRLFGQHVNKSNLLNNVFNGEKHDKKSGLPLPVENLMCLPACMGATNPNETSMKSELTNKSLCTNTEAVSVDLELQHNTANSIEPEQSTIHLPHDDWSKEKQTLMVDSSSPDGRPKVIQKNKSSVLGELGSGEPSVLSDQTHCTEVSSTNKLVKSVQSSKAVKESEIIVVDSSSEEVSENSEQDIDMSDSDDPMEECLRIFNEFAEREVKKEETFEEICEDHFELDGSESTSTEVLNGQRKRIAHPAKFDEAMVQSKNLTAKSNKEVLVPLREPAPPPVSHTRILRAQQQAVQITAAVRGGQDFVAAVSNPNISQLPTQVHRIGKIVYVNIVDGQPTLSTRIPSHRVLQRNSFAAVPYKSKLPYKKILQQFPAKLSSKVTVRRRPSVIPEPGSKVPHEMRQRYVNFFVEEHLKMCTTVHEAFDKALTEEKGIYDRCGSKNMYLNISVNTLKKLRDQNLSSNTNIQSSSNETNAVGAGKQGEKNDLAGAVLYKLVIDYLLTEEQLKENGYPRPNPEKPGSAILHNGLTKNVHADSLRRVCCRCGEMYAVTSEGKHVRKEECNYHSGKVLRHRVPGGLETRYSCCEAVVGTPGCQVTKLHVHEGQKDNLDGFMTTFPKPAPVNGDPGVFAVDCEMCYTTQGLNLTRVTVVDPSLQVIYDTFVKPDNEVIDYNTRFSGVTEDDLKNVTTTIRDVQAIMLNLFSADTILIGHSLESDLFALKLIHNNVVDTAIVFPHRLGLPHKRALRNLMADYLRRIIQDDVGGHDSREDAAACMELLIWKIKEDTKGKRW